MTKTKTIISRSHSLENLKRYKRSWIHIPGNENADAYWFWDVDDNSKLANPIAIVSMFSPPQVGTVINTDGVLFEVVQVQISVNNHHVVLYDVECKKIDKTQSL